jgi:hypothetical protein
MAVPQNTREMSTLMQRAYDQGYYNAIVAAGGVPVVDDKDSAYKDARKKALSKIAPTAYRQPKE